MTKVANMSNVAYKKGNWMRYALWGIAAICIGGLIFSFVVAMNEEMSSSIPDGYKFALTDDSKKTSGSKTTYYVYDNKILVENEEGSGETINRIVMMYNVNTEVLDYDAEAVQQCELDNCKEKSEILESIKHLILWKTGREYRGL